MKPILYSPKDTNFENNGIGVLVDAISCEVTEERNGSFELVMRYPVTGQWYSEIKTDCKIKAKPNNKAEPQLFVVYAISKPLNGIVTINAEHISYQLSSVIVLPFTASSSMAALDGIKYHSANENPFVFEDHWKGNGDFSVKTPSSARSLLGGVEGSIIDTYGGEYEFDNYAVRLWANRGKDNGVVIAYAKNLTGVKCDERIDGIATGCLGYYKKEEDGVEVLIYGDLQTIETDMSYSRDVLVDFSSEIEEGLTRDEIIEALNKKSKEYLKQAKNSAYFSVSVEFVNLGDTEEYKQYKELEEVNLCDTVTISHPYYGISVKSKVVRTVYDCLKERYIKIDVGEVRGSLAKTIAVQSKEIKEKPSIKEMNAAYENANWWITNGQIGEIVMIRDKEGKLVEIASLDTGDKTTAKNVWRWNNGGFAHSSMGYNLPDNQWDVALLSDGTINADMLKTGTIQSLNRESSIDLATGAFKFGDHLFLDENGRLSVGEMQKGTMVFNLSENDEQYFIASLKTRLSPFPIAFCGLGLDGSSFLCLSGEDITNTPNVSFSSSYTESKMKAGSNYFTANTSGDLQIVAQKDINISAVGDIKINGKTWDSIVKRIENLEKNQ